MTAYTIQNVIVIFGEIVNFNDIGLVCHYYVNFYTYDPIVCLYILNMKLTY